MECFVVGGVPEFGGASAHSEIEHRMQNPLTLPGFECPRAWNCARRCPFSFPPERLGGSIVVFTAQVMPETFSHDSNEDSDGIPLHPSRPRGCGDEVSEVRLTLGEPLCGCGFGVQDSQSWKLPEVRELDVS